MSNAARSAVQERVPRLQRARRLPIYPKFIAALNDVSERVVPRVTMWGAACTRSSIEQGHTHFAAVEIEQRLSHELLRPGLGRLLRHGRAYGAPTSPGRHAREDRRH